jgi:hypothetical protein
MKGAFAAGQLIKDRTVFAGQLAAAFEAAGLTLDGKLSCALLAPGSERRVAAASWRPDVLQWRFRALDNRWRDHARRTAIP